jgi:hypothetical protein
VALIVKVKIMVYSIEVFSERRLVFHQGPSVKTEAHLSELRRSKSPARFRLRMTILLVFIMRLREGKMENSNTYI